MELFAGCRTKAHERALEGFLRPFRKTGRIVTPDSAAYEEAGRALSRLARSGIGAAHRRALVNDLLIAVSAYRGGLVVVTSNEKDFRLLEKHTPMRWLSRHEPQLTKTGVARSG